MIYKESLHNILKHAKAIEAEISLSVTSGNYKLCIKDNSKGFDSITDYSGNGLKNMKLRAARIHANIDIENKNGTRLCLSVKIP